MSAATTLAFDRLAADYDSLTSGEIFRVLRARVHCVYGRYLNEGTRVLEIGCGTGVDTEFLASRGAAVVACDPSEEMVSRTLRRLARAQLGERASVVPCGLESLESYLERLGLPDRFDAIVSNFGALNCVADLTPLAALAKRRLQPNGIVLLGLMTPFCAFEAAYFVATRRPRLARRRAVSGPVSVAVAGIDVATYYHRIDAVCHTLRELKLEAIEGLGVVLPPPYLERHWRRLPRTVRTIATTVDGWLAPYPPFNRVGDHVLLRFRKDVDRG